MSSLVLGPTPSVTPSAPALPTLSIGQSRTLEGCNFLGRYSGAALPVALSEDALTLSVLNPEDDSVLFKLYRIKRDKDWFQEEWEAWD